MEKFQDIINGIRNEKVFWYLMKQEINAEQVFKVYVMTRNQRREIVVGDLVSLYSKDELDPNDLDKKIISNGKNIETINFLNDKIQEKEKIIIELLENNPINFSESEIQKIFENIEEYSDDLVEVSKKYNQFLPAHLDSLIKSNKTGISIWNKLKEFVEKEHDFEYDSTGEDQVSFLVQLKMLQTDIRSVVIDLLSNKIENKDVLVELRKALTEWHQLQMLRWCIIDYSLWTIGKNGIQIGIWHVVGFFL
jgi:hypothetical protein